MNNDIPHLGMGIGLRRQHSEQISQGNYAEIDCFEIAPENYLHTGGKGYRELYQIAQRYPIICHGLSLSLGSLQPIDWEHLKALKTFISELHSPWFSDHLCYSSVRGKQFHNLLPLPLTEEAVQHVSRRIREVQDFLELPFAIENISYYAHPGKAMMPEWEFVAQVLEYSQCYLLLDVNNIYVNSVNHRFDPYEYLRHIPLEKVIQIHIAGHRSYEDFLLDNHGAEIIHPVWDLLRWVCQRVKVPAIIIERDNNIPPLEILLKELHSLKELVHESDSSLKSQPS